VNLPGWKSGAGVSGVPGRAPENEADAGLLEFDFF
jgi:hypothetical protein